uniref:Uncharacterized protein n=1 Tax=Eutreptiella gymnastica TaxID=73025 RepID=A0A7S4G0N3_9EUGL
MSISPREEIEEVGPGRVEPATQSDHEDAWAEDLAEAIYVHQNRARQKEAAMAPEEWVKWQAQTFRPWQSNGWSSRLRSRCKEMVSKRKSRKAPSQAANQSSTPSFPRHMNPFSNLIPWAGLSGLSLDQTKMNRMVTQAHTNACRVNEQGGNPHSEVASACIGPPLPAGPRGLQSAGRAPQADRSQGARRNSESGHLQRPSRENGHSAPWRP